MTPHLPCAASVRRAWWRTLVCVAITLAIAAPASAGQPAPPAALPEVDAHDVVVTGDDGTYTVAARFQVAQTAAVARAVLSDYEAIPRIIPDVRRSVVVQREPLLLVAQEAVSHFGLFSRTIHLLLEVTVSNQQIAFIDRSGKSFTTYHGAWHLQAHDGGTAITYALTARPAFKVPAFLIRRLMSRDAREMIGRLSRAIETHPEP